MIGHPQTFDPYLTEHNSYQAHVGLTLPLVQFGISRQIGPQDQRIHGIAGHDKLTPFGR